MEAKVPFVLRNIFLCVQQKNESHTGGDTLLFQETETEAKKSSCVVSGKMASSMGGMFTGQQPSGSHPPTGPGQPGLLTGPPGNRGTNNTLVDDLEASFEACFASLVSQDYVNGTDQEEIRTGVDQCIQKFLDVARQTECFFLQKRLQLSVQKPEQVEKEDASELKNELQRKEMLIQKHLVKIHHWQQVLEDINVQHKKPTELPQGPLAFLEQASANLPAPMKPN
ncbi:mediator of RNA polymerase II transcription subunit [Pimephales promelas]|nr:mediator of RNA polymerase II transcription subunit [Pimephales promelas]